ncbi:hypothetical protein FEM48_Zijuj09G0213500 [Ziziphus jujuba var. spinosa]|uniref:adenylate kinase n=1 Tax=Ziziphus jujuba var. spinosa TaxID=714518 RepID=A0A978UVD5_ZIZJJ|nr:hypothetical protein FEM48_Zijuj09G0213500 [Ziziphus jujuba var. spinosa]
MAGLSRLGVLAQPLTRRLLGLVSSRAYGSSAAAQLQYDYDDYYEEEDHQLLRHEPKPMVGTDGWVPERGVQWVLMGDRGAKKHVYAERLSKLLEVPHISMGSLVRQELNPRSSLYKQIANAVNEGKLVPEEIIFGLLTKRLEEGYCRGETGFILEGIPRTRIQAEILDQIVDIDLVVNFKSTETQIVSPQREFLSVAKSSATEGGGPWKENFHFYAEQRKQLEDYYKKQKKLLDFEVGGAPGETWQGLLAALHLQHINAVSSSQKLTA